MGILDDSAIFAAIIQQGGFARAAKHLGLSNGLVSRRIALLETKLGVSLIKRTTRELHLTPEGELFWQHARRIQQELDSALSLIQSSANKPKGRIKLSAPPYFGRHYLTPILVKFLKNFKDIQIDLVLSNAQEDPIQKQLDLMIRGAGYIDDTSLKDSSLQMKLLLKEKIGLYASAAYLQNQPLPETWDALQDHNLITYYTNDSSSQKEIWSCVSKEKKQELKFTPVFTANDIESAVIACISGCGIGRFTSLNVKDAVQDKQLLPVMQDKDFGHYHLYAVYPHQEALPIRTRLLLDFIHAHTQNL